MKIFVRKASDSWREGSVKEYANLQDCIDTYEEIVSKCSFEFDEIKSSFNLNQIFHSELIRRDGSGE